MSNDHLILDTVPSVLPRLYERDIDVLLQEELLFNAAVRELFARALKLAGTISVSECQLSNFDATGETDVLANFSMGERRGMILIENKIDAAFQPRQAERYKERAVALSRKNPGTDIFSVLVAPSHYYAGSEYLLEHFDATVSYEEIADATRNEGSRRSHYRADLVLRALEQARNAYVLVPSDEASDLWMRIYEIARDEFPALQMPMPGKKGSQSKWMIFKADLPNRVSIDWKITKGTMDLSFWKGARPCPGSGIDLSRLPRAKYVVLGDTTAISLPVPKPPALWTSLEGEAIRGALTSAQALLTFFRNESASFSESGGEP